MRQRHWRLKFDQERCYNKIMMLRLLAIVGSLSLLASAFAAPVPQTEDDFMAEADRMAAQALPFVAVAAPTMCCSSTETNPVVHKDDGCCNTPGSLAKFKVWAGKEYHFFGCEGSAKIGRIQLQQSHERVGAVQPVLTEVRIA